MKPPRKGFSAREIVLVLAAVAGLATAGATVLYRKARQESIDKAVMCPLRQLAAAADQYYLENGVSTVRLDQLVGATNYIKALSPVAGETYPACYTQGHTITVTGVAGARTVTYAP